MTASDWNSRFWRPKAPPKLRYHPKGASPNSTDYVDAVAKGPARHMSTGRAFISIDGVGPVPLEKIEVIPPAPYEAGYGC